ncbi:hypothetical protein LXA43DRAFT_894164 [Ganoderma leucocontextum]|nr:hypothetical protein LXA43DRAFT_894164 [Ganoderma leucocontextum]
MHPQQPQRPPQDNAAMPVDYDTAQQQQQQQQVHPQMPTHPAATNVGPPQVNPMFAPHAHPGLATQQAVYGQYATPTGAAPMYQGHLAMSMQPMPMANPGYNAAGPFGPAAPVHPPSITIPQVQMPPGVPPLMTSRQALQWQCLSDDLMPMVHREGCPPCTNYSQHLSHFFQVDPSLPIANTNTLRDRQVRMHEFFQQHLLSEGGGRSSADLICEIEQLTNERDTLQREVNRLESRLDQGWSAADHYQEQAECLAEHDNECRPSRPRPRHRSPQGYDYRRFDDRRLSSQPRSSRGGSLQLSSSRQPLLPPQSSFSHQPYTTTSTPAISRQLSTSMLSASVGRPSDHWPMVSGGTSHVVHGPEVVFDSDEWDDYEDVDIEGYDRDKGKQRAFNVKTCTVNRRDRDTMTAKYAPKNLNYGQPSRPPSSLPGVNPAPLGNPALDPPRVPGGQRGPRMDYWPRPTDVRQADQWVNYIPLTIEQYRELVRSARAQGGGAYNCVRDLLHQYDTDLGLRALGFLHQLKQSWSDPHCDQWSQRQHRSRRPDQSMHSGPHSRSVNEIPRSANPSRNDPPEAWMEYWNLYPAARPTYIPLQGFGPQAHQPEHVRGHLLLRRINPRFSGSEQSSDRAHFMQVINQLFSISGLYRLIIDQGRYPQADQERFLPYPGQTANVSIYDIAGWFARCGLTTESIELMTPMAIRHRHETEGRSPHSSVGFMQWPLRLDEITAVPSYVELLWTSPQVPPGVADGDTSMEDEPAGGQSSQAAPEVSGSALMDETPDPVLSGTTTPAPNDSTPTGAKPDEPAPMS